jgi:hypothetical protein
MCDVMTQYQPTQENHRGVATLVVAKKVDPIVRKALDALQKVSDGELLTLKPVHECYETHIFARAEPLPGVLAALDISTEGYVHARSHATRTKTLEFLSADETVQELCNLIENAKWVLVYSRSSSPSPAASQ